MKNFEELFDSFSKNVSANTGMGLVLLNASAPIRIYYGIGAQGFCRLAFLCDVEPPDIPSTRAIKVSVVGEGDSSYWVFFDLVEGSARPVYVTFCEDLVRLIENSGNKTQVSALALLKNRYLAWRKMFSQDHSGLSEEQMVGLWGELYFLHTFMMPKYGIADAITSWSGIDGLNKDFAIANKWYEVKTASVNGNAIRISSLAQLSSNVPGSLVIVRYETMSDSYEDSWCTVYRIFRMIMTEIDDDELRAKFIAKLIAFGFDVTAESVGHRYRISDMSQYKVDGDFPRIQESDIKRKEIDKVSYSLIINSLEQYKFDGEL